MFPNHRRLVLWLWVCVLGLSCQQFLSKRRLPNRKWQTKGTVSSSTPDISERLAILWQPSHVPLLPWENQSLVKRICQPPAGTPLECCVGSSTDQGDWGNNNNKKGPPPEIEMSFEKEVCNKSLELHHFVAQRTIAYLEESNHSLSGIECDVCQIVRLLSETNSSLAFVGDSMMQQTFSGMECELRRRGFNATRNIISYKNKFLEGRRNFDRHGVQMEVELKVVVSPQKPNAVAVIRFFKAYRHINDKKTLDRIVRMHDVILFDHGLHYRPEAELSQFIDHASSFIDAVRDKVKLLLWRETPSQHFRGPGGYYRKGDKFCQEGYATESGRHENVYRNAMHKAMNQSRLSDGELGIIPFREFTLDFQALHPGWGDCSHYCTTPYLWLPIWKHLRLAMDALAVEPPKVSQIPQQLLAWFKSQTST